MEMDFWIFFLSFSLTDSEAIYLSDHIPSPRAAVRVEMGVAPEELSPR